MRNYIAAIAVGLVAALVHLVAGQVAGMGNDLYLAYGAAQMLLGGANPYSYPNHGWPTNPMPTVLAMVPFVAGGVPLWGAGVIVAGAGAGLYTYGSLARNEPGRLWALLSFPAVITIGWAQWPLVLLGCYLVPQLAPLTLVKPHNGWIVGLLGATRWRAAAVAAVLALCWLVAPSWLPDWLGQVGGYTGQVPALVGYGAGSLGLLVLLVRHDRPALLYAGLLCSPIRLWYDSVLFFGPVSSARANLVLAVLTWLPWLLPWPLVDRWPVVLVFTVLPVGLYLVAEKLQPAPAGQLTEGIYHAQG